VAVLGASMGAAMSLCAMAQPAHPFKAAVLESAFPTLLHFWSRYPIPRLGIQLSKILPDYVPSSVDSPESPATVNCMNNQ